MAVSKRLRFEIFARDDHRCRYCGRDASEVVLQIDHIQPVSLGGTDHPSNLATACRDCNSGKASVGADAPPVATPSIDALRWRNAMEEAASDHRRFREAERLACDAFESAWPWSNPPDDWHPTVSKFVRMGLNADDLLHVLEKAIERTEGYQHCWNYFCKVAWSEVRAIRKRAEAVLREDVETYESDGPPDPAAGLPDYFDEVPDFATEEPPFYEPLPDPRPFCIECDTDRRVVSSGMCAPCLRAHYEGTA